MLRKLAGQTFVVFSTAVALQPVQAQTPAPEATAQVIDLAAMTDDQIGASVPNLGTLRTKTLVNLPDGVVSVQVGDPPKHTHQQSVEIQYVIAGEGTIWLGDKEVAVHAGELIVVPKGTAHGGSHSTKGHLKLLAIKLPPRSRETFRGCLKSGLMSSQATRTCRGRLEHSSDMAFGT